MAWKRNFYILWSGQYLAITGLTVLVPFLPFYMQELGASSLQSSQLWSGLALAAPAISSCITSPLWGKIGDRFGRKLMVVRALVGLSACLLLMAFVTTPIQFLLVRLFQGAFGGVVDASSAFAGSEAPEDERGKALGSLQSAVAAGSLSGPLLGGIFIDLIGFRALFMIIGVLTGVGALVAFVLLTERNRMKSDDEKAIGDRVLPTFISMLSHARTRGFLIAGFAANVAVYGLVTPLAPFVEQMTSSSSTAVKWIGLLQVALWTATLLSAPWWGKQNDRFKVERNYMIAAVVCGLSVLLQGMATNMSLFLTFRILQGLTVSALIQSVMYVIVQSSDDFNRGVRVGACNSVLVSGQVVGSIFGAWMTGFFHPHITFLVMGFLLIGSVCSFIKEWTFSHIRTYRVNKRKKGWDGF